MAIHETPTGFVISSHGVWLPGVYQDKRSANYAFRFTDKELYELNNKICHINGEDRNITFDDLKKSRQK